MRKKESWMKKGAIVLAGGQRGVITRMQENSLNGTDYVYYIDVRIEGKKHGAPYHPNDVQEYVEQSSNQLF
jgi:hypothetical protein